MIDRSSCFFQLQRPYTSVVLLRSWSQSDMRSLISALFSWRPLFFEALFSLSGFVSVRTS